MPLQIRLVPHHIVQIHAGLQRQTNGAEFAQARGILLNWLEIKTGLTLPPQAREGISFDMESSGYSTPTEVVANENLWAMRFEHPDDTGRVWRTEAVLGSTRYSTLFGTKLVCLCHEAAETPFYSIPQFVSEISNKVGILDASHRISTKATLVAEESEVQYLANLLHDPRRTMPIIVVSENRRAPDCEMPYIVNPHTLARRTHGIAHVFALTHKSSWIFSNIMSKDWAVYNGAVRFYRPRLDTESDELFRHPIALRDTVERWGSSFCHGASSFSNYLIQQSFEESQPQPDNERNVPAFPVIKNVILKQRADRQQAEPASSTLDQQVALMQERIQGLELQQKDTFELAIEQSQMADALAKQLEAMTQDRNSLLALTSTLRYENARLTKALNGQEGGSKQFEPIPKSLDGLGPWAEKHFPDKLVILRRAISSAKKADFEDTELVYRSLILLATTYYDMIFNNTPNAQKTFREAAKSLCVDVSKTFAGDKPIIRQDSYSVPWGREKRYFDKHLTNGNNRDPRYCLRIYFFDDSPSRRLVIGHLPSHLPSTLT